MHRGFGRQAAAHCLGDPPEPTAVGGEHPIGFDDIAVLTRPEPSARIDERIDRLLHRRDRIAQPLLFGDRVFCHDLPNDDLWLMQERRPDRQPGIEAQPVETDRQGRAAAALGHFERIDQLAAGGELGDDHRDRLQYLDFVFGVVAGRAVLDDEDAQDAVAAQDRHAH